VDRLMLKKQ